MENGSGKHLGPYHIVSLLRGERTVQSVLTAGPGQSICSERTTVDMTQ